MIATKDKPAVKMKGHEMINEDGSYELRKPVEAYKYILMHENAGLRLENAYFWNDNL